MLVFIVFFALILLVIFVFNPKFDIVPLYEDKKWLIMWYNRYNLINLKVTKERTWCKMFYIEK